MDLDFGGLLVLTQGFGGGTRGFFGGFAMRVMCVADIMAAIEDWNLADLPVAEWICEDDDDLDGDDLVS